jgi:HlyD family secretion protein
LIKPGQKAEVFVTALPGQSFQGRVERVFIEPERREGAVLYPVRLSVDNPQGLLLPGMTARARMEVARAENVLSAHEAALRFQPSGVDPAPQRSRVFRRVSSQQIEPVSVRTLVSDGVYAQIEAVGGAVLREHDQLAVGLQRPESGSGGPSMTLGDKKK